MATLLTAAGDHVTITPAHGPGFTLAELQGLVGGYIEVVATRRTEADGARVYMVVNEDGKRLQLPVNVIATVILGEAGGRWDDIVVGDVVLATMRELDEPEEGDEPT
jgi:hypothetical protein